MRLKRARQNLADAIGASDAADSPIIITLSVPSDIGWSVCQDMAQRIANAYPDIDVKAFRPSSPGHLLKVISGKACIRTNLHPPITPLITATMQHVTSVYIATTEKMIDFMNCCGQGDRVIPLPRLEYDGCVLSALISSVLNLAEGSYYF